VRAAAGCSGVPTIEPKTVGMMGLKGAPRRPPVLRPPRPGQRLNERRRAGVPGLNIQAGSRQGGGRQARACSPPRPRLHRQPCLRA
jgi:hypothetical protein